MNARIFTSTLMKKIALLLIFWLPAIGIFAQKIETSPYGVEELKQVPSAPDYANLKYWIAHPTKIDNADAVPGRGELNDRQAEANADVFFVYPTIYTGKQNPSFPWFADVNDAEMNDAIANSTIKYQSSVFNDAARIYSPLYRQAHISVFFSDSTLMKQALEAAYQDVKAAFEYYLKNWHNDRPLIIASHSQGTVHAARLLKEYVDGKPLQDKLVAAYIIGMPVPKNQFAKIPICDQPDQTGCWITWNTYLHGYSPPHYAELLNAAGSVNPLTWKTDSTWADWELNKGGILKNFRKIRPGVSDAQNHRGMLWIRKPRFFGNFLLRWKRYHVVDYNLFYLNIRENAVVRVNAFLKEQPIRGISN